MNTNTFAGVRNYPGPTSATETAVAVINPLGGGSSGYTQQTAQFGTTRQLVGVPPDVSGGIFDGSPFKIRYAARAIGTGAGNFTVNVYWNNGVNTDLTTFTSDVLVIGSGAIAVASKPALAFDEVTLMWDSKLQSLAGFWNETSGMHVITSTGSVVNKSSAAVTATDPLAALQTSTSALNFFITFTCSANISSTQLIEFSLERV
jgi:hypothetical protein